MICQRSYRIQVTCKVRTIDCLNAHITDGVDQRFGTLMALVGQDKEIIPFRMADKDDGCGCAGISICCRTDAADQTPQQ